MRLLVTGGYGFIGSAFVRYVIDKGDSVCVVDRMTVSATAGSLKSVEQSSRFTKVVADIRDLPKLHDLFYGYDFIVHFAAETHVDRSIGAWEEEQGRWTQLQDGSFIESNVLGLQALLEMNKRNMFNTRNVLDMAKRKKIPMLLISTDEVYGPTTFPASEDTQFRPTNPYSASKVAQEALAHAYWKTFGVPVASVRLCNNYGPFQSGEKLIPMAILRLLENQEVPVHGDGKQRRDWIYVEDTAQILRKILTTWKDDKDLSGEAYNIPAGKHKTVNEVVETIARVMSVSVNIAHTKDRPGQDFEYQMDGFKLKQLIGSWLHTPFDVAIGQTVAFYKQHRDFYLNQIKRNGALERARRLIENASSV